MSARTFGFKQLLRGVGSLFKGTKPSSAPRCRRPGIEGLEERCLLSAAPVLMVLANQDFHYGDYAETRLALENAGLNVAVAAGTSAVCKPHMGSGQGNTSGWVQPNLTLAQVDASQYSAIVFVGGWGASSYQYAFSGTYGMTPYNGTTAIRQATNQVINDFMDQDKYVGAICTGVSVLAWARVDGQSPLAGKTVSGYAGGAPQSNVPGATTTRWHVEANGAAMVPSGSVGNPYTAADDVMIDGKVITAEDFRSARAFGQILAEHLLVPTVSVSAAAQEIAENGGTSLMFTVQRGAGDSVDQPLMVAYTLCGTAEMGSDFQAVSGSVLIPAGQTSATISLTPINDAQVEGSETVSIMLQPGAGYALGEQNLATATMVDEDRLPVLMVIANRDFYYKEYADTRLSLEAAGLSVQVAAQDMTWCIPHWNSGQGSASGQVMPDVTLVQADAADYSAIVFVGGWGASAYQYGFEGTYHTSFYNGAEATRQAVNQLINDFVAQDKYVTAICHGVSVLAWARVDGQSLLDGKTVTAWAQTSPAHSDASVHPDTTRWHIEANGATMLASRSIGNPYIAHDDVLVDGKIITAENWDSALLFGQVIAEHVLD